MTRPGIELRSPGPLANNLPSRTMNRYNNNNDNNNIALVARISLTLSRHSSLSFIALGRSSGQHPVSSHSCWMYVRAGRPAFARPCVRVHKSTSLMSSSLLLQQCPACLEDLCIQTDHLISVRRSDLIVTNNKKENLQTVDFAVPAEQNKTNREWK